MSSFWTRTKRRAVAVLAASAASAAAAYCAYTWYYASSPADAEPPPPDHASSSGSRPPADTSSEVEPSPSVLLEPSGGGPGTAQMDAEAHLQHHFRSIQAIAEGTTLPSLLPTLSRAVAAADDLDAALERLRLAKEGAIQLDPEEKQTLWRELSIDALARLVAALWMLPLLCLQVRVQLNILGRHLYLESALADPGTALPGPSRPPRQLTPASQEAFLSHAEYLAKSGHVLLLKNARHAAQQALQSMSLTAALDAAGLQQLLSEALAEFVRDSSAVDGRWAAYLLPPPQELRESLLLRRPDNRAMLPGAERTWVDAEAVEGMVGEVGSILASERFHDVAMSCAQGLSSRVADRLTGQLHGGSQPLAKVVPSLATEAKRVLAPHGECAAAVAAGPQVEALCATVYSCGPPF